ncbi:MAG: MMPL family transporter, partial [Solirubrobacteraceae bacterium]|nr:MMPL family transporter [Solirubrobacteraceae bacterium]
PDPTRPAPPRRPDGTLAGAVRRAAAASARRPRRTIALWLLLVAVLAAAGAATGMRTLTGAEQGTGPSAQADRRVEAAGLEPPAVEQVLVRGRDAAATAAAARALERRLGALPEVAAVTGPDADRALTADGGRTALVRATLRGDPDDAADTVVPVEQAVAAVAAGRPGVRIRQAGAGTIQRAFDDVIDEDLQRANVFSLPIILLVLLVAFGAVVAACVPLLLGVTSVVAALGAAALLSQAVPMFDTAHALVVLIGLAVGVDYSLFSIRREREERRAGRGPLDALDATAATVGRAIVVAGLTVVVAISGLLITGLSVFASMALATMLVVAIAVVGSVTVLPAVLALLGDRVDAGRRPWLRRGSRPAGRDGRRRWASAVTRRPALALAAAVTLLVALAVPLVNLHTASMGTGSLPPGTPAVAAQDAIERAFPGAPGDAELVVTGAGLDAPGARGRLQALGERARAATGGRGAIDVAVAADGRTAVVSVPMPDRRVDAARETVAMLRGRVAPTAAQVAPGAEALVTGDAARDADFTDRLRTRTPVVIAFVLALAFALLLAAFRSPALAATVVGLNLLSVGAAYGVLVAVFQHGWAEPLLGFTSTGAVSDWLPLFAFVILFGLSMDYTILVLERMREARRAGRPPRAAAAEGVAATAGSITSAAVVMVAVFAVFATMAFLDNKQLGVGLAVAIALDATVVRGIALPAAVALLGERGWRVRPRRPCGGREAVEAARRRGALAAGER